MNITFDPGPHTYAIDGAPVPNVTSIIARFLPYSYPADPYVLERGRVNHECYRMLVSEMLFDYDPKSGPWIDGWLKWEADFGASSRRPEVVCGSKRFGFAGTADLICYDRQTLTLADYKNSFSCRDKYQLGAYSIALKETTGEEIQKAFTVQINGDGGYKMSAKINKRELQRYGREFLAMLATYKIQEKEGIL